MVRKEEEVTTAARPSRLEESVLAALAAAEAIPNVHWLAGDDKCDCMVQRIGEWSNPYTAYTKQIRLCCIWEELERMFPKHVQNVPAYYDENRDEWTTEVAEWDSEEADMPLYLWYRQYARKHGLTVGEARNRLKDRQDERPRKVPAGTGRKAEPSRVDVAVGHLKRLHQTGWNTEDFAARLLGGSR